MSWKTTFEPLLTRMPGVERPASHVSFNKKLAWTAGVLVLYFYLTNVTIYGMGTGSQDLFGQFRTLLAGSQGSVLQLGIGPIVTASIVLQLLGGAGLLGLDDSDPRDQRLYQGLQKLLVIAMIFLTGIPMVFSGGYLPASQAVAQQLGIGLFGVKVLMFLQIAVGGVFILMLDEIVSKWGIGSGIGLFIIAGVSQSLVGGMIAAQPFTPTNGILATWIQIATGAREIGGLFTSDGMMALLFGEGQIVAILTTLLIFAIVVYAESVRVELPLSHANVKGARGKFPIKLIYASVLPMILVRALQANIQFVGRILNSELGGQLPSWFGVYVDGQPISGLMYYLAPVYRPQDWMWWLASATQSPAQIMGRVAVDLTFMIVGGAIFAVFWVETTGMGPESVAEQIHNSGMQIPGFRRNTSVLEKVVERYIPAVTIIGGALVGLLAVAANMMGTIGQVSGTGLLLTVSITYKLYEEIAEEKLMEMHPMMRDLLGG